MDQRIEQAVEMMLALSGGQFSPQQANAMREMAQGAQAGDPIKLAFLQQMLQNVARGGPQQVLRMTKDDMRSGHFKCLEMVKDCERKKMSIFKTKGFSREEPTVRADFSELAETFIHQLKQDTAHDGKYLICRTVFDAYPKVALETIIEDKKGEWTRLALYNFGNCKTCAEANKFLPTGSILAIKAPYYRIAGDCKMVVRSDNGSNVKIIKSASDPLLKGSSWDLSAITTAKATAAAAPSLPTPTTADEWRVQGNEHFKKNDLQEALSCYEKGCELNPQDVSCRANIVEVKLRMGDWISALDAADVVLTTLDENHAKTIFRKARALAKLGRYEEAIALAEAKAALTSPEETAALLKKLKRQQAAAENGQYDWNKIFLHCMKQPTTRFDLDAPDALFPAEFIHPSLEVVAIPGKGLGVITKEKIPAEKVIVVSKASAVVFASELSSAGEYVLSINMEQRRLSDTNHVMLQNAIRNKTSTHVNEMRALWQLPAAAAAASTTPSQPPVAIHPSTPPQFWNDSRDDLNNVAIASDIVSGNAVGWSSVQQQFIRYSRKMKPKDARDKEGSGIWLFPSRFNHSCIANCSYYFFGDMMVIVSGSADIEAGAELTLQYTVDGGKLKDGWNFTCNCEYCQYCEKYPPKSSANRKTVRGPDTEFESLGIDDFRQLLSRWYESADTDPKAVTAIHGILSRMSINTGKKYNNLFLGLLDNIETTLAKLPSIAARDALLPMTWVAGYFGRTSQLSKTIRVWRKIVRLPEQSHFDNPGLFIQLCEALSAHAEFDEVEEILDQIQARFLHIWPGADEAFEKLFGEEFGIARGSIIFGG